MAHRNLVLPRHPGTQLSNRRVRLLGNTRTQHVIVRLKARPDVIMLRSRRGLAPLA
jgi:hypothetical protein